MTLTSIRIYHNREIGFREAESYRIMFRYGAAAVGRARTAQFRVYHSAFEQTTTLSRP